MKIIKIKLTNNSSHIENEDYFSLRVVYESSTENIQHIGFYNSEEDLLELAVDKDSCLLQKLQMIICHHYSINDFPFDINSIDIKDEEIELKLQDHNECQSFYMHVYSNCAVITLSDTKASKHIKCGQILFGLNDADKIHSIIVTGLTKEDINHVKNELSLQ